MSIHSTGRSKYERAAQSPKNRLLYSRKQVAAMLGDVNISTIRRLEAQGRLKGVRLSGKKNSGQVFFTHSNVVALIASLSPDEIIEVEDEEETD